MAVQHSNPNSSSVDASDRRGSGKRARSRDRLMDRATRPYPKTRALERARPREADPEVRAEIDAALARLLSES